MAENLIDARLPTIAPPAEQEKNRFFRERQQTEWTVHRDRRIRRNLS
jgi:hypothetical protein